MILPEDETVEVESFAAESIISTPIAQPGPTTPESKEAVAGGSDLVEPSLEGPDLEVEASVTLPASDNSKELDSSISIQVTSEVIKSDSEKPELVVDFAKTEPALESDTKEQEHLDSESTSMRSFGLELAKPEDTKSEDADPEILEPTEPKAVKSEPEKPHVAESELKKEETAQAKRITLDSEKTEFAGPETTDTESTRLESFHPESTGPETIGPESSGLESVGPESTCTELAKTESAESEEIVELKSMQSDPVAKETASAKRDSVTVESSVNIPATTETPYLKSSDLDSLAGISTATETTSTTSSALDFSAGLSATTKTTSQTLSVSDSDGTKLSEVETATETVSDLTAKEEKVEHFSPEISDSDPFTTTQPEIQILPELAAPEKDDLTSAKEKKDSKRKLALSRPQGKKLFAKRSPSIKKKKNEIEDIKESVEISQEIKVPEKVKKKRKSLIPGRSTLSKQGK